LNTLFQIKVFLLWEFLKKKTRAKLQEQWALEKIKTRAAWNLMGHKGSRSVVIAVLDTGVDSTHESLATNMLAGYDFKDNDADPSDVTSILNPGHGTHCAGIAGATGNVAHGISGASPVVSILPVRILGKTGGGEMDDAVQGIDYAIQKGAHVISASWSGEMLPSEAAPLIEAVERARDAGITFVTSSGNGDENGVGYNIDDSHIYPAGISLDNVITVAATDEDDYATSFSNVGFKKVHIAAPGFKILSTLPKDRYDVLSGTSMSAPLVAGVVALIKSVKPQLSPLSIRYLLQATGKRVEVKTACNCRVDAAAAVEAALRN
jgi:thermitase